MNKRQYYILFILVFLFIYLQTQTIYTANYENYSYDFWGNKKAAPNAYVPRKNLEGIDLGIGHFNNPQDLFVSNDNIIYILDTGNNRIIIIDDSLNLVQEIKEFEKNGKYSTFNSPQSIFVTGTGNMYIADTNNSRIIELDKEGQYIRHIQRPDKQDGIEIIPDNINYRPTTVAVDENLGRIYVLARNIYDGILQFNIDGYYVGFIGAIQVSPSVTDIFWHSIATDEQRARMRLFLPTEYTNITLDKLGFIYTVHKDEIKWLNPMGQDRLSNKPRVDLDLIPNYIDIISHENNIYSVLDSEQNKILTYDHRGTLLSVLGGRGDAKGRFRNPSSIASFKDNLLVLDRGLNRLTFFEPTKYAILIQKALATYYDGLYEKSVELWKEVIRLNANFDYAYSLLGRNYFIQREYEKSMQYYLLANDRNGYSQVYAEYRNELIGEYFSIFIIILISFFLVIYFINRKNLIGKINKWWYEDGKKKNNSEVAEELSGYKKNITIKFLKEDIINSLIFSFYTIFHPFKGHWALKHEKKASLPAAMIITLMVIIAYIFQRQYTGFIFNTLDLTTINIYREAVSVLLPLILWCIVNFSITTIFDGKGSFSEIFIATTYSLIPIPLIIFPITILSNFMVLPEQVFINMLITLSAIWSLSLVFIGNLIIHEYSLSKNIIVNIATIVGMAVVMFIALLFISLAELLFNFLLDFYRELILK